MMSADLQQQIVEELSSQMQSEIDFEILSNILVKSGWVKVQLKPFTSNNQAVDIMGWCHETLKQRWQRRGTTFVFESAKEANWFVLRWA